MELHAHPHPRHRVDTLKHITIPFYDEFKQHDINVPIYATMRDIIPAVSQVIGDAVTSASYTVHTHVHDLVHRIKMHTCHDSCVDHDWLLEQHQFCMSSFKII